MKTQKLLLLFIFIIGVTCCKKDESVDTGLYFCNKNNVSEILVKYNEILGYDSINYIFRVTESAWNRINHKITPSYPDPHFGFGITLNSQIIYSAQYIPGYYSMSYNNIITFMLSEPDLIFIRLGYPSSSDHFSGVDYRNDSRIITQLKKDNKLIAIKN
jgi:hypothetical protein